MNSCFDGLVLIPSRSLVAVTVLRAWHRMRKERTAEPYSRAVALFSNKTRVVADI